MERSIQRGKILGVLLAAAIWSGCSKTEVRDPPPGPIGARAVADLLGQAAEGAHASAWFEAPFTPRSAISNGVCAVSEPGREWRSRNVSRLSS
jgi:hypothetical protein